MMRDGECYRQPKWERRIGGIGYGLWRTPTAEDSANRAFARNSRGEAKLSSQVKYGKDAMWPTPSVHEMSGGATDPETRKAQGHHVKLTDSVGGQLNPTWVEWLMGWILGLTDLEPLEMDKFQLWLQQHGGC
jgi:hypothetical protein